MKMLLLVYRHYLETDVQALLRKLDVKGFTESPRIYGAGETGTADGSLMNPSYNSMIFTVMPDDQIDRVVAAFKELVKNHKEGSGRPAPLRAFILPCVPAI